MEQHFHDIDGSTDVEGPLADSPRCVGTHLSKDGESTCYSTNPEKCNNAYYATTHQERKAKFENDYGNANEQKITKDL
jgi:hypothetical protein